MRRLEQAGEGDCVDVCDGQWRLCAQEILEENDIGVQLFRTAVNGLSGVLASHDGNGSGNVTKQKV